MEQQRHGIVVDIPRHRGGLFRPHPAVGIVITCPTGSTLEVKAESADIDGDRQLRRCRRHHRFR